MNLAFNRSGLPIAAYLGMLVALALTAAFAAMIAVVIWLPPRPPDVMRADIVAEHFKAGYEHMQATGRPLSDDNMVWNVRATPPDLTQNPGMHVTHMMLAHDMHLREDQIRVAASRIAQSDVFVFRVREAEMSERRAEAMQRRAEEIQRRSERGVRVQGDTVIVEPRVHVEAPEAGESATWEYSYSTEDAEAPTPAPTPRAHQAPTAPAPPSPPTPPRNMRSATPVAPVAPVAPTPPPALFAPAPPGVVLVSGFEIGAQLPDGRWLVMRQGRNWAEIGWISRAVLVIGGTLLILSLLAVLFARRLTRPIRNFSDAVQAVGVDPGSAPVAEEGPKELRGAARAVNTMQARLRALIADRTKTLAAVAHDMRTPLMRLRLQAENAPPDQRDKMAKEIAEVEALVASFIAFARDDPAEEARVRLDLSALLQSIADDHTEHGRSVTFEGEERFLVTGQSLGLKRLFGNLVDNALKYGASAAIALKREDGTVVVDVQDDGPGIPADQRESVFEPFVRLNDETRGAGLGLAAARSIARAHGGDIAILDADKGTLMRVTLPA